MTDLDRDNLDRVLPPAPGRADWNDVLRRADASRARNRLGWVGLVAATLVVVGAASAFGTVRELVLGPKVSSNIAFMHNTRKNCCPHELWIMDADGSRPLRLARDASGAAWSPDGRQIAYFRGQTWRGGIYVVGADGNGRRQLARWGVEPDWSPDGGRIVFVSRRDRNAEVYVMNADGSAQRNLTRDPGADLHPAWSPAGRWIAFLSRRDESYEIDVMNADGSDRRSLARARGGLECPRLVARWSEDRVRGGA